MMGPIRTRCGRALGLATILIASLAFSLMSGPGAAQAAPTAASVQAAATYSPKKGPSDGKGMILAWSGCPGDMITLQQVIDLMETARAYNIRMKFALTDECVANWVASTKEDPDIATVNLRSYARTAKQQVISGGLEGKSVTGAVCNPRTAKQRARKAAVHNELDTKVVTSGYFQPVNGKIDGGTHCELEQLELTVWTWSVNPLAKDKHGKLPSQKTVIKRVATATNSDTVKMDLDSPLASGANLEKIKAALPPGKRLCRISKGQVDNKKHDGEGALPILHC